MTRTVPTRTGLAVLGCVAALGIAAVARAHDYWLLAEPLRPTAASMLALHMLVGERLVAEEERPFVRDRTRAFVWARASGTTDLLASASGEAMPAFRGTPGSDGGHLFAMERTYARIELPPLEFDRYLRAEGHRIAIAARRAIRGARPPGRERYARCLKAFVQVGAARDDVWGRTIGCPLEIVMRTDLSAITRGRPIDVEVLFRGSPLPRASIDLVGRREGDARARSTVVRRVTDRAGRARFVPSHGGVWLVRLAHMVACTDAACDGADWESWWSSYSFAVPETAVAPRRR